MHALSVVRLHARMLVRLRSSIPPSDDSLRPVCAMCVRRLAKHRQGAIGGGSVSDSRRWQGREIPVGPGDYTWRAEGLGWFRMTTAKSRDLGQVGSGQMAFHFTHGGVDVEVVVDASDHHWRRAPSSAQADRRLRPTRPIGQPASHEDRTGSEPDNDDHTLSASLGATAAGAARGGSVSTDGNRGLPGGNPPPPATPRDSLERKPGCSRRRRLREGSDGIDDDENDETKPSCEMSATYPSPEGWMRLLGSLLPSRYDVVAMGAPCRYTLTRLQPAAAARKQKLDQTVGREEGEEEGGGQGGGGGGGGDGEGGDNGDEEGIIASPNGHTGDEWLSRSYNDNRARHGTATAPSTTTRGVGKCHVETNSGSKFPDGWVWVQSQGPEFSLLLVGGVIDVGPLSKMQKKIFIIAYRSAKLHWDFHSLYLDSFHHSFNATDGTISVVAVSKRWARSPSPQHDNDNDDNFDDDKQQRLLQAQWRRRRRWRRSGQLASMTSDPSSARASARGGRGGGSRVDPRGGVPVRRVLRIDVAADPATLCGPRTYVPTPWGFSSDPGCKDSHTAYASVSSFLLHASPRSTNNNRAKKENRDDGEPLLRRLLSPAEGGGAGGKSRTHSTVADRTLLEFGGTYAEDGGGEEVSDEYAAWKEATDPTMELL
eukprot:GHVU01113469.1.p1 GENE.GHVU01113469.1~~GHVU01113469.1.p1  ORF type:complete len:654 (+),score=109.86 GHVU01113469.1:599-2560(+)